MWVFRQRKGSQLSELCRKADHFRKTRGRKPYFKFAFGQYLSLVVGDGLRKAVHQVSGIAEIRDTGERFGFEGQASNSAQDFFSFLDTTVEKIP